MVERLCKRYQSVRWKLFSSPRGLSFFATKFRRKTGGGSAILDPKLRINSFEMFSDSR
jgi:hypothetical protein